MSTCAKCSARILWREHQVTQRAQPIDAEPFAGGNILLARNGRNYEIVKPGEGTHQSHYVTCPYATWFRNNKHRG